MHTDETGEGLFTILLILAIGAIIGGAIGFVTAYNDGVRGIHGNYAKLINPEQLLQTKAETRYQK